VSKMTLVGVSCAYPRGLLFKAKRNANAHANAGRTRRRGVMFGPVRKESSIRKLQPTEIVANMPLAWGLLIFLRIRNAPPVVAC
jgi:hypothetical protein